MVEGEKKGLAETQWFPKAELNFIHPLDQVLRVLFC